MISLLFSSIAICPWLKPCSERHAKTSAADARYGPRCRALCFAVHRDVQARKARTQAPTDSMKQRSKATRAKSAEHQPERVFAWNSIRVSQMLAQRRQRNFVPRVTALIAPRIPQLDEHIHDRRHLSFRQKSRVNPNAPMLTTTNFCLLTLAT
ncbi:MAG: hypothetical protein VB142_00930 [Burkholderia sp.]